MSKNKENWINKINRRSLWWLTRFNTMNSKTKMAEMCLHSFEYAKMMLGAIMFQWKRTPFGVFILSSVCASVYCIHTQLQSEFYLIVSVCKYTLLFELNALVTRQNKFWASNECDTCGLYWSAVWFFFNCISTRLCPAECEMWTRHKWKLFVVFFYEIYWKCVGSWKYLNFLRIK